MRKTNYHRLASLMAADQIDSEVREVLDAIVDVARRARTSLDELETDGLRLDEER